MGLLGFLGTIGRGITGGIDDLAYNAAGGPLLGSILQPNPPLQVPQGLLGQPSQQSSSPVSASSAPPPQSDFARDLAAAGMPQPQQPQWQPDPATKKMMRGMYLGALSNAISQRGSAIRGMSTDGGDSMGDYRKNVQALLLTQKAAAEARQQLGFRQQLLSQLMQPGTAMPAVPGTGAGATGNADELPGAKNDAINAGINSQVQRIGALAGMGFIPAEQANAWLGALEKSRPAPIKMGAPVRGVDPASGKEFLYQPNETGGGMYRTSIAPPTELEDTVRNTTILSNSLKNASQSIAAGNVTDQASYDDWKKAFPKSVQDVLPRVFGADTIARVQRMGVSPDEIARIADGAKVDGNFKFFLNAYAQKLGYKGDDPASQLTYDQRLAAFPAYKELNSDPELRAATLAMRNMALSNAQLTQSMMPTADDAKAVAADILHNQMSPSQMSSMFSQRGAMGAGFKLKVFTEAKKMDPNFSWEQAESNYQYGKSQGFQQSVRMMDSTINSIPQLAAAAQALNNNRITSLNAVKNWTQQQTGGVPIAKFNTDRLLVGDEIAKILSGGGSGSVTSDNKLNSAMQILRSSDSPAQIAATLGEVQQLLNNRRYSVTQGTYLEGVQPQAHGTSAVQYATDANGKVFKSTDNGKTWNPK